MPAALGFPSCCLSHFSAVTFFVGFSPGSRERLPKRCSTRRSWQRRSLRTKVESRQRGTECNHL